VRPAPVYRVIRGKGPALVLVHGSATDADGWTTVFAKMAGTMRLCAYDRRGTDRSPLPPGRTTYSVDEHARDLLNLLPELSHSPPIVCGSSFGAVVALHAARVDPTSIRGLVLCEPPLPASDDGLSVPDRYMAELLRRRDEVSSEAAGVYFLERVLGPEAVQRMPAPWRARCAAMVQQVVLDSQALQDYRPRYDRLRSLEVATLLLEGERSTDDFPPALDALERSLPRVERRVIAGAGHMIHADHPAAFRDEVVRFTRRLTGQ